MISNRGTLIYRNGNLQKISRAPLKQLFTIQMKHLRNSTSYLHMKKDYENKKQNSSQKLATIKRNKKQSDQKFKMKNVLKEWNKNNNFLKTELSRKNSQYSKKDTQPSRKQTQEKENIFDLIEQNRNLRQKLIKYKTKIPKLQQKLKQQEDQILELRNQIKFFRSVQMDNAVAKTLNMT